MVIRHKEIIEKSDNFFNNEQKALHLKYRSSDNDFVKILNRNSKFYNINKGKRCFILGNGPSLNGESLDLLKDEKVFTVNQLYRSEIFEKVNSDYHVMIDQAFFEVDNSNSGEVERIEYIKKFINSGKTVFLHHASLRFIDELDIDKENVYFLKPKLIFTDMFDDNIDITHLIPEAQTVVQTAIYVAMYMGFTEIYLLGCDMTGILQNYVKGDEISFNKYGHAYNYTGNEANRVKQQLDELGNETLLWCFFRMFELYRKINNYANRHKISIKNLTTGGALDVFERDNLENILKGKKYE